MSRADEQRAKLARMRANPGRADVSGQPVAHEQSSVRAGEQESKRAGEQTSKRAGEQASKGADEQRAPIFPGRTRRRPAVRVDDVKFSVLLSPRAHGELVAWCAEAAAVLGRTRVPTTDAVKALVTLLAEESSLGDAVIDELEKMDRAKMRRGPGSN